MALPPARPVVWDRMNRMAAAPTRHLTAGARRRAAAGRSAPSPKQRAVIESSHLLELPHAKVSTATLPTPAGPMQVLDLHCLKTRFPFIAMMPQTRFLDFITAEAQRYPNFQLIMR